MISAAGRVGAAAAAAANALPNLYLNLRNNTSGGNDIGLLTNTTNTSIGDSNDNLANLGVSGVIPLSPSYSPMAIPFSPDIQDLLPSERYYFDQQNTMYNNNNTRSTTISNGLQP